MELFLIIILTFLLLHFYTTMVICGSGEEFDLLSNNFSSIQGAPYFVDKTMLIKEFFKPKKCRIIVTAPPRFGKSTNMDMLRRFCEIQVDAKTGQPLKADETENFKIFAENNLLIYRDRKFFDEHFGKYPVIYLDFKRLSVKSHVDFFKSFLAMIGELYSSHAYLLQSKAIGEGRVDFEMFHLSERLNALHPAEVLFGGAILAELLYTHFKEYAIVFIEDYDALVQEAIRHSFPLLDDIATFIRDFIFNLLRPNRFLHRALLNACVSLPSVISTDTNRTKLYAFSAKHPFNSFYGLTEEEVFVLTTKFEGQHNITDINAWYAGYRIVKSDLTVYNVFSVVNHLRSGAFEGYWTLTGYIPNLDRIFLKNAIRRRINSLVANNCTKIKAVDRVEVGHILRLTEIVHHVENCTLSRKDVFLFLQFMTDMGYFTQKKVGRKKGRDLELRIPNKEVKLGIFDHLYSKAYYKQRLNLTEHDIGSLVSSVRALGQRQSTHRQFAAAVLNLFAHVDNPENETALENPVADLLRLSKAFKVVKCVKYHEQKLLSMFVIRNDRTGIVVDLKFDTYGSSYHGLFRILSNKFETVFDLERYRRYKVKNKILVALFVREKDHEIDRPVCTVSYLYNSVEITKNKNVIVFGKGLLDKA